MTNKRILTLITLLLFLFLLVGCDWLTPNRPPEIKSVPVTTATLGLDYTYNVVATDPDGDVLDYFLTTEPKGMLIDESNGKIVWKADDITTVGVGDYDVVVVVSDEEGLSDSQDFTITVSELVVELVGIEVDPEEMTLCLKITDLDTETFEVIAHYNDDTTEDVTLDCVYGIDDISIATIDKDAGKVTAESLGETIIIVTYKGKTDTIEVTVTRVPMEITAYMPLSTVGEEAKVTINIVANSDVDKEVEFCFTLPGEEGDYELDSPWGPLLPGGSVVFVDSLFDEILNFEVTFNKAGIYETTIEIWTVTGTPAEKDVLLCSKVITAEVVDVPEP